MADKYNQPLVTFYLRDRPAAADRGEDFRRAPDAPPLDLEPRLDTLIRSVRVRHGLAKSLLEEEEATPLAFVGSRTEDNPADVVAKAIETVISFDLARFRQQRDAAGAFTYLRSCLESCGIFVMLVGDLGSHHSRIGADIFRGYAIADPIAPFIIINDNDSKAAWSFTALHEAAHIWLGHTGVSGASDAAQVEKFCNKVAGLTLFPRADVEALAPLSGLNFREQLDSISQIAGSYNVSRRLVAYQLLQSRTLDRQRYRELTDRFHADWLRSRDHDPDEPREGRGPHPYVVRRQRLGPAIVNLAQRSVVSGVLSPTKASKLLGVKPGSVHALLNMGPV